MGGLVFFTYFSKIYLPQVSPIHPVVHVQ